VSFYWKKEDKRKKPEDRASGPPERELKKKGWSGLPAAIENRNTNQSNMVAKGSTGETNEKATKNEFGHAPYVP